MATRQASARPTKEAAEQSAKRAREKAETGSGWYAWLARGGLLAKGTSFAVVAVLAIGVAAGTGGKTTSRQGALQALAQHGWGKVLSCWSPSASLPTRSGASSRRLRSARPSLVRTRPRRSGLGAPATSGAA
jgi:hypothetical protein